MLFLAVAGVFIACVAIEFIAFGVAEAVADAVAGIALGTLAAPAAAGDDGVAGVFAGVVVAAVGLELKPKVALLPMLTW